MVAYVYKISVVGMLRQEHYHVFEANLVYKRRYRPTREDCLKETSI